MDYEIAKNKDGFAYLKTKEPVKTKEVKTEEVKEKPKPKPLPKRKGKKK